MRVTLTHANTHTLEIGTIWILGQNAQDATTHFNIWSAFVFLFSILFIHSTWTTLMALSTREQPLLFALCITFISCICCCCCSCSAHTQITMHICCMCSGRNPIVFGVVVLSILIFSCTTKYELLYKLFLHINMMCVIF